MPMGQINTLSEGGREGDLSHDPETLVCELDP